MARASFSFLVQATLAPHLSSLRPFVSNSELVLRGADWRMSRLLEIDGEFRATVVARRLGGPPGAQHALRFTLSAFEGDVVGGYTVVVS